MSGTTRLHSISIHNEAYLSRIGAIQPPRSDGFRTLSRSILHYSSSSADDTVEIPVIINSRAGLQFCGFTPHAAGEIFAIYTADGTHEELDIFACAYVDRKAYHMNAVSASDDWDAALARMGMNAKKRAAILDPTYDRFRLLQSADTLAKEIVTDSYEFLLELDNIITCGRSRDEGVAPSPRDHHSAERPAAPTSASQPRLRQRNAYQSHKMWQAIPCSTKELHPCV